MRADHLETHPTTSPISTSSPLSEGFSEDGSNIISSAADNARGRRKTSPLRRNTNSASKEDQRIKNRIMSRRCYYKKVNTLRELQEEVTRLERESKELLALHRDSHVPVPLSRIDEQYNAQEHAHLGNFFDRYVELALLRESLEKENGDLRQLKESFASMEKEMMQLTLTEKKTIERNQQEWTERREHPVGIVIHSLDSTYCNGIALRARERMETFNIDHFATGPELFGWKSSHTIEDNCLSFYLAKKDLTPQSASDAASRLWTQCLNSQTLQKLYSPRWNVRFHVLQRVDADHIVYYRTFDHNDEDSPNGLPIRMKTLLLLSRQYLGDGKGWLITSCALDPGRVLTRNVSTPRGRARQEPTRQEMWIDNWKWMLFEPAGANGEQCRRVFGGILDACATPFASQWMLELLWLGVRCDRQGVDPIMLLE